MQVIRSIFISAALILGGLSSALANDPQHAHGASDKVPNTTDTAVGSNLPPKLRALLIQEMMALLNASQQVVDALVRGQDEVVARQAQGMHDSFILAQEMSEADMHALHEALPQAFIERDEAFHELSADLAAAARAGDKRKQRELFAEMIDACVACHAAHATDRFPGLASGR